MGLQRSTISYKKGGAVEHYFLCHYKPRHIGADRLSASLLRFKQSLVQDLPAWIDCALSEIGKMPISSDVIVMRALGSRETKVGLNSNTSLDQLGRAISERYGLTWMPELIGKPRPTRPLKLLGVLERLSEVRHAYYLSSGYFNFDHKRILLIDDILTTGATVRSIIRLVKAYFPKSQFKVFTLAKTVHETRAGKDFSPGGLGYTWEENRGWIAAETDSYYTGYEQLRNCILNDCFDPIDEQLK